LSDQDLSGAELNQALSSVNSQQSVEWHYQREAILSVLGRPAESVGKKIRLYRKRKLTVEQLVEPAFFRARHAKPLDRQPPCYFTQSIRLGRNMFELHGLIGRTR
jgi:hypothetical protein